MKTATTKYLLIAAALMLPSLALAKIPQKRIFGGAVYKFSGKVALDKTAGSGVGKFQQVTIRTSQQRLPTLLDVRKTSAYKYEKFAPYARPAKLPAGMQPSIMYVLDKALIGKFGIKTDVNRVDLRKIKVTYMK